VSAACPNPGELDALYDEIGDVIAKPLADDVRDAMRAFFNSYRGYRLAKEQDGPAALSAFAGALSAYARAREVIDALGAQESASEVVPDASPSSDAEPIDASKAPEAEAPASSMPVHPAAAIFPMMLGADLDALADDIKANGQREPIVVLDGKIVDGRNRAAACAIAGVEPLYREWDGEGSLVSWILSVNLRRRHLTDQQRAVVAARAREAFAAEAEERRNTKLAQNKGSTVSADLRYRELSRSEEGKSAARAAEQLHVSTRAVEQAAKVIEKGDESLVEAVTAGAVSLDAAASVAALPREEQRKLVEEGGVKAKASEMRKAKKQKREAGNKGAEGEPSADREPGAPDEEPSGATDADAPDAPPSQDGSVNGADSGKAADARLNAIENALRSIVRASQAIGGLVPERSIASTYRILEAFVGAVPIADNSETMRENIKDTARGLLAEPKGRARARPTTEAA
jgi:predicted HTH domain antitoxin